jgi:hypothetical protein
VKMMAAERSPYLLLPDEATLTWLEQDRNYYFINRETRPIMTRLLALNKWISLGTPVRVDSHEKIEVFAPRETH